ncbi:methyltransferase [Brachybacterium alimentarium]|uniref:Methyltransferase n=1 Tax=Brachybacterium alimentarium TaxID=47845 RepID=A0A2A3YEJ4_9MICO|nr:SAM-dependent methyltransferase [Brachybacterium alimentarium]PCC37740.1 methyltransferase [Brachybacterium alimentarium]
MSKRARPPEEALADVRTAILDDETLVRGLATGSRRGHSVPWRRIEFRYVELKSGLVLQLTSYDEYTATVRNAPVGSDDADNLVDEMVDLPFANWHVDTTSEVMQLRITKKGEALLHVEAAPEGRAIDRAHDRQKPRMLPADHPVLRAVGISDQSGQIKPSRQSKYRQVDEFLRLLDKALDSALESGRLQPPTADGPLRMVDLGCGNAYLTFAAAAYVQDVRREPLEMVGIDVRPQARDRNTAIAHDTGLGEVVTFQSSTIAAAEVSERPDVVLSLHACDTATDEALARAIRWRAPVILAAPCCHHDIQAQMSGSAPPDPYTLISRHGVLRERFADVMTDALRASIVRQEGYRVDTVQFVGSQHTPRNTLLRAVRTDSKPPESVRREYDDLILAWHIRPALERMLETSEPVDADVRPG